MTGDAKVKSSLFLVITLMIRCHNNGDKDMSRITTFKYSILKKIINFGDPVSGFG